ncbi:MAG: hypothetical protein KGH87_00995 [Thaumarchaeota archaeon]|nr:hypothetical protein [Nitrososphaerota archaeon]
MLIQYIYTLTEYFRIQTSHPEDLGKTRIRMEKTRMQQLGIQKGDMVKMTGGKTAYAFCLPWDDNYDDQNERNFVCLDESSKNIPVIRVSDLTYSNLRNFHFGNLVELQKSNAVKASKVTVKPLYVLGGIEKENFNLDWLEEQVAVSKGDRIVGRNDDPKKIPGFFVIGGTPDSEAWIIDKDTPVEISDKIPDDFHRMITAGGNLNSVIPVVRQIKGDDFEATISAIEVYDNCMKILMYVKDIIVHQEDWTGGLCTPTIKAWDDLGNQYVLNRYSGRGGGTQFGDSLWGKTNRSNFSEISCILTPTLDKHAQELTLSIEQLLWDVRKHPMPQRVTPVTKGLPTVMTPVSRLDEKFVIHGGPWEFKIKLGENKNSLVSRI